MLAPFVFAALVSAAASSPPPPMPLGSPVPSAPPPGATAPSSLVSAETRPSKAEVPLGEEFEVEVVVRGPQGTSWTWPAEALGDEVELRSLARGASPGAWSPGTHRYGGVLYALGEVELPTLVLQYRLADGTQGEVTPTAVKVRGLSVLAKSEEEQKLADVRPPVSLSVGVAFWLALGLLLGTLGLGAFVVWRLIRRRDRSILVPPEPEVTPDREALAALDRLAAETLAARGDLRGHYIALTVIAKRYLERRLGAPVLEMTTAETLALLRDDGRARECSGVMRDVSIAADAIKFARGTAAIDEAGRHLDAVRGMVRDTEARLVAIENAARETAKESSPAGGSGLAASGGGR